MKLCIRIDAEIDVDMPITNEPRRLARELGVYARHSCPEGAIVSMIVARVRMYASASDTIESIVAHWQAACSSEMRLRRRS